MSTKTVLNGVAFIAGLIAVFATIGVVLMLANKTVEYSPKDVLAAVIIIGFVIALGARFAASRVST